MVSRINIERDLRTVSEYVTFKDAAKLLGTTTAHLKRVLHGKATLTRNQFDYLHEAAMRARRREGQIKSIVRADLMRKAKREAHETLRKIGHENLKIPDNLPPFLRWHETGQLNSPVYIYDFRDITPNDVMQFFRFQKTLVPSGWFFFTYQLHAPGITHDKNGMIFSDKYVEKLKLMHGTKSAFKAIISEIGTAAAGLPIEKIKGGFKIIGLSAISTRWQPFCVMKSAGTCEILTDLEFYEIYSEYNNHSIGRYLLECGISRQKPMILTPEEIAEDVIRGADPETGMIYVWQD